MAILSPECRKVLKCFGVFTGQRPKDQFYIRITLKAYLSASEDQRRNYDVLCAGSDLPHELKSLRNQCMFGSSCPPFGGFLVVDIAIYGLTNVNPDDIRVTDLYSDFRVDRLMLSTRYLRHVHAPTVTKAGTKAFCVVMMVARVAHESLCPALDRPTRLFMLNWALQVLTSWALPLNTFRGVVTSLLPLIMACLRKDHQAQQRILIQIKEASESL